MWLPWVCQEMLFIVNKHPGVLVLVCLLKNLYTINCKMLLPYLYRQMLCQKLWQMLLPMKYVNLWQMESHCCRCCNHLIGWLADVNAKVAEGKANFGGWLMLLPLWQMEWPHRMEWFLNYDRCYCLCGRWNSHWVNCLLYFIFISLVFVYFILCSGQLKRTSSHMWGRWYLPIFLFRDGLLTLMYIDFL